MPWRGRLMSSEGCEVVMAADDAGTGRSQAAGGAVPDPPAWETSRRVGPMTWRYRYGGNAAAGQIMVENLSGRTCRLNHQPWVMPLGTDGHQLPVEAVNTMELRLRPVILAPGGTAAPVGWAGWYGDAASGVVRSIGSAARPLSRSRDPANRTAPTPGSRRPCERPGSPRHWSLGPAGDSRD
jgi:hypothetical protein